MKYEAERAALKHLLEACENYERVKQRFANVPESMKPREVMQTEMLRLHVACGSWVLVKKKTAEQSVDDIFDTLERYELAADFVRKISRFEFTKSAVREMSQDLAAELGLSGKIDGENSPRG